MPGAVVVDEAQEPATQKPGQPAGGLGHQVGVGSCGDRFASLGVRHHRDRPEEGGEVLVPRATGERLVHAGGAGSVLREETLGPPPPFGVLLCDGVDVDGVLLQQPPHRLGDGCDEPTEFPINDDGGVVEIAEEILRPGFHPCQAQQEAEPDPAQDVEAEVVDETGGHHGLDLGERVHQGVGDAHSGQRRDG